MLPVTFPEQNIVLGKPDNMTDEECMSLPAWRGRNSDGLPVIISKWKLSKEDLDEINRTGEVWLQIVGPAMPPASVFTEYPFIYPDNQNSTNES